ncbi:MAG TPA: hypothetical protein VN742_07920, partial [Candidatus Binataceae bacterium]|nr:hypothetical protein [Candidatus Binataceae bacterium]
RQVPARSILICCVVFSLLVPLGFMTLVDLDVLFYMMALMLEMGALLRLRRLRPQRDGLFVLGGGRAGLYLVVAAPLVTWLATFGFVLARGGDRREFGVAIALLACAWPLYAFLRGRYGGPPASSRPIA